MILPLLNVQEEMPLGSKLMLFLSVGSANNAPVALFLNSYTKAPETVFSVICQRVESIASFLAVASSCLEINESDLAPSNAMQSFPYFKW